MTAPSFRITTRGGDVYVGPVMGFGSPVVTDGLRRIEVAIERAGGPLAVPLFEPKRGHARVLLASGHVDVPLAGATVEAVTQ